MTREEAISIMNVIIHMLEPQYDNDRVEEAVDMAIKALEQEPCEDAVSRQAVITVIKDWWERGVIAIDDIRKLPSVTPARKSGLRWIERFDNEDKWLECPHCHMDSTEAHNYCPHCGADMRGREHETN